VQFSGEDLQNDRPWTAVNSVNESVNCTGMRSRNTPITAASNAAPPYATRRTSLPEVIRHINSVCCVRRHQILSLTQRSSALFVIVTIAVVGLVTTGLRFLATTGFNNDHFVHLSAAQQMLYGDWPTKDFIDIGRPLTILVSALGQRWIRTTRSSPRRWSSAQDSASPRRSRLPLCTG
jgi:hypothetical protein